MILFLHVPRRGFTGGVFGPVRSHARYHTIGWYLYTTYLSAPESVQHLDIPYDGTDLAEPAAVVRSNESAVQLVTLGLLAAEDPLYHPPLVVLFFIEYLGRLASVGLAAVNMDASLFDVGYNPHLEQHLAVVV